MCVARFTFIALKCGNLYDSAMCSVCRQQNRRIHRRVPRRDRERIVIIIIIHHKSAHTRAYLHSRIACVCSCPTCAMRIWCNALGERATMPIVRVVATYRVPCARSHSPNNEPIAEKDKRTLTHTHTRTNLTCARIYDQHPIKTRANALMAHICVDIHQPQRDTELFVV